MYQAILMEKKYKNPYGDTIQYIQYNKNGFIFK